MIKNINEKLNGAEDIDGFEDLTPEDQAKVKKAVEDGHGKLGALRDCAHLLLHS